MISGLKPKSSKKSIYQLQNRQALITGAGSGIGRALAIAFAKRGCDLILADLNLQGANETAQLCSNFKVATTVHELDVGNEKAIISFGEKLKADLPQLDLLINNAGIATGGTFEQIAAEDFDRLMNINFFGVVRMCRAFLPLLRRSDEARIVNLSSIFGVIAPPSRTPYVASKFAVRGFSISLAHELEETNVGVSVVYPGGVATSIARNALVPPGAPADEVEKQRAHIEKSLRLSPETAAEIIVTGIENRKSRILVGQDAKVAAMLERIFPTAYWSLIKKRMSK